MLAAVGAGSHALRDLAQHAFMTLRHGVRFPRLSAHGVVTLTLGQLAVARRRTPKGTPAQSVGPLPLVLLRRGPVSARALGGLLTDPRVELLVTEALTPEWSALAHRVAGVLVVTEGDPLGALVYALTAQVRAPIVVGMSRRHHGHCRDLMAAGAAACLTMPITRSDLDRLLPILRERAGLARIDSTLHLLLDPIARAARFEDRVVRLSQRQFALLHYLSSRHGEPVCAEELLTHVWGDGGEESRQKTRQILDIYIHQLRRKLHTLGLTNAIATVRLFGYALGHVAADDGPPLSDSTRPH